MLWLVAKESRAVNKPSRSFTVPGEGPYLTWAFSLYRAPTFPATESSRTLGGSHPAGTEPLLCAQLSIPVFPVHSAAAVLVLHPAQPLHLHCDQHPGLGEPPADLPHQHAPLGQTQLPVLTVIWLLVNIINGWKTQNQKQWQITLRWWLRRNVF